jgi:hypothetical protein
MRAIAGVVLAAFVVGCTSEIRPSPSTATTQSTFMPLPISTPSVAPPPSERELSDRFWGQVITYAPMAFEFHTLEEIVTGSDLIVRGRIVGGTTINCWAEPSPRPGRESVCGGSVRSFLLVAVDRVLKSDGRHAAGTVHVQLGFSTPTSELPRGDLVLFLKNSGQVYSDEVAPEREDSPRWGWYFLATSYQGALRNLDGVIDVPEPPEGEVGPGWWADYGPFPTDIDGQPFEEVVARIRDLVVS